MRSISGRKSVPSPRSRAFGRTIVINLAAYTDVDGCEKNREEAFRVNAEGMKHVAMGAKACGAKVVYLSTDYVFDGEKEGTVPRK